MDSGVRSYHNLKHPGIILAVIVTVAVVAVVAGTSKIARTQVPIEEANRVASIRGELLAAQPGDIIEYYSGELYRVASKPRDGGYPNSVDMRVEYPGMSAMDERIVLAEYVRRVYHHEGKIYAPSLEVPPSNPEKDAWRKAAERYVLQGLQR